MINFCLLVYFGLDTQSGLKLKRILAFTFTSVAFKSRIASTGSSSFIAGPLTWASAIFWTTGRFGFINK